MSQEFNNVWDAIEADPVVASNLRLRSHLMLEIADYVQRAGLTQAAAAKNMGTTQPRLNDILKGRIEKCTVDRLVNMLTAVGYRIDLEVSRAA